MDNKELKKTAERVMQSFVNEFAGRAHPKNYRYCSELHEAMVRDLHTDSANQIHGASLLMISFGRAEAGEYQPYLDQLDAIRDRYLAEFQAKPEAA